MKIRLDQVRGTPASPWGPRRKLHDSLQAMGHGASFDQKTGDLLVSRGEESARVRFGEDGNVSSVEESSGRSFQVRTDPKGRIVSLSSRPGREARFRYDPQGRLTGTTDANGFSQDLVFRDGRPVELQRHGLKPVHFSWGEDGSLRGLRDGRGASVSLACDPQGRVTRFTARSGASTAYRYGAGGRLEEVRLPGGSAWRFVESPDGRSGALVRPDGSRLERISVGPATEHLVRADGSRVSVELDEQGLPKRVTYPDGNVTSYRWGAHGRPEEAVDGPHKLLFEYDDAGRCTAEELDGVRVECRYGRSGAPSGITLPTGESVSFEEGPDGRVETVKDWEGNAYRVEWTPGGQVSSVRFPGRVREAFSSHASGRLQFQELWAGDRRFAREYSHDENDLVCKVDDSERGVKTLRFDEDDRLVSVSSPLGQGEWCWDGNGNAIFAGGRSLEYDALDRISGGRGVRCRTDEEGKLLEWEDERGRTAFRYDGAGRLVRAELPNGGVAEYEYDPIGRRISKKVDGRTTRFLWLGTQLLSESTDGPEPTRTDYLYLPGTGRPLSMRQDGRILFFQVDHLDTPIRLVDRTGSIAWDGEPLGTGIRVLHEDARQPLRFPGQYHDAETGLHYNVTRYYQPATGRYVTPDPPFFRGQENAYLYARGNPSAFADPLGQFPPLILAAGGAVLVGAGVGVLFAGGHQLVTNAIHGDPWDKGLAHAVRGGAIAGAAGGAGAFVGGLIGFALGGPVGAVVGGIIGGLIGGAIGAAALAAYDAPKGQGWQACKDALVNTIPFVGSVRRFLDNPNDPQRWPQLLADVSFDILGLALMALGARRAMARARTMQPAWEAEQVQKAAQKAALARRAALAGKYQERVRKDPKSVWAKDLNPDTARAVDEFVAGKELPNGEKYGQSVKNLDLEGKTPAQLEAELTKKGFTKNSDVIRDPKSKQPVTGPNGETYPQDVYTHPDGGMVRVKPEGQPNSPRSQPHAVKAVRNPPDGSYQSFDQEGFKVDNEGNPQPKFPKDADNPYPKGTPEANDYLDGWAETVHTDLG